MAESEVVNLKAELEKAKKILSRELGIVEVDLDHLLSVESTPLHTRISQLESEL
jgi:hypothetical protein